MLVEHISALTGDVRMRDTTPLGPEELKPLEALTRLPLGRHRLPLGKTGLFIQVTISAEGAIFDLQRNQEIIILNICNFSEATKGLTYPMVVNMSNQLPFLKKEKLVRPKTPFWIYSIPINPFASPQDLYIAGSAELSIYYALYQNPSITVDRPTTTSPPPSGSPKPEEATKGSAKTPDQILDEFIKLALKYQMPVSSDSDLLALFFALNHYISTGDIIGTGNAMVEKAVDPNAKQLHPNDQLRIIIPVKLTNITDVSDLKKLRSRFDEVGPRFGTKLEYMDPSLYGDALAKASSGTAIWTFSIQYGQAKDLARVLVEAPGPLGWGSIKKQIDESFPG